MTENGNKISRLRFFKILSAFLLIPSGLISLLSLNESKKTSIRAHKLQASSLSKGFYCSGDFLISNYDELKIYSSKCTHLGCRINTVRDGEAVCSCHGSMFNAGGQPVQGPASKPLTELKYTIDKPGGEIIVYENR